MFQFNHFNFNVADLERSVCFYKEALGLEVMRTSMPEDGSFILKFMGDPAGTPFKLELTWLRDRTEPYDLGEQEFHLCMQTDDMEAALAKHTAMGCVCQPYNGRFYFIEDPDGYWIEIIPAK